jgi:gluconate 2-dehydrogenase gamma chain
MSMIDGDKGGMNMNASRRSVIQGLLALPMFSLASCKGMVGAGSGPLTKEQMTFLSALSDTIIPTRDTPGAVAAKVPETLEKLIKTWASAETQNKWHTILSGLKDKLNEGGANFAKANSNERTARLGALDKAIFDDPKHPLKAYRDVKSTIATAYYMSEPGATQDLRYAAVPGDFNGDAPVGKTWAT